MDRSLAVGNSHDSTNNMYLICDYFCSETSTRIYCPEFAARNQWHCHGTGRQDRSRSDQSRVRLSEIGFRYFYLHRMPILPRKHHHIFVQHSLSHLVIFIFLAAWKGGNITRLEARSQRISPPVTDLGSRPPTDWLHTAPPPVRSLAPRPLPLLLHGARSWAQKMDLEGWDESSWPVGPPTHKHLEVKKQKSEKKLVARLGINYLMPFFKTFPFLQDRWNLLDWLVISPCKTGSITRLPNHHREIFVVRCHHVIFVKFSKHIVYSPCHLSHDNKHLRIPYHACAVWFVAYSKEYPLYSWAVWSSS